MSHQVYKRLHIFAQFVRTYENERLEMFLLRMNFPVACVPGIFKGIALCQVLEILCFVKSMFMITNSNLLLYLPLRSEEIIAKFDFKFPMRKFCYANENERIWTYENWLLYWSIKKKTANCLMLTFVYSIWYLYILSLIWWYWSFSNWLTVEWEPETSPENQWRIKNSFKRFGGRIGRNKEV